MYMRSLWMMVVHQHMLSSSGIRKDQTVFHAIRISCGPVYVEDLHCQNVVFMNSRFVPINQRSFHIGIMLPISAQDVQYNLREIDSTIIPEGTPARKKSHFRDFPELHHRTLGSKVSIVKIRVFMGFSYQMSASHECDPVLKYFGRYQTNRYSVIALSPRFSSFFDFTPDKRSLLAVAVDMVLKNLM